MNRRTYATALLTSIAIAGAGFWLTRHSGALQAHSADLSFLASSVEGAEMAELELRNKDIEFFEERARRDPESAADLAWVARLYLQRSRETGDFEDFQRAEDAARRSLAIRTKRNESTYLILAYSLLGQHRFVEALEVATQLVEIDPEPSSHRALLAELQLELGDYEAARATLGSLEPAREHLSVAPRLARWAEITGRPREERRILYAAREQVVGRHGLPRETVAWFHLRLGDHELRNGRLKEAQKALVAGLAVEPADHRLWAAMARLEAARQQWQRVIEYGERAGERANLATLGLMGDAYAALGDGEKAEAYYRALEKDAEENAEPFNRQLYLFRLDHGRRVPETLAILQEEIETRPDIYGYDLLAWALYQSGDYVAAREAMTKALRMGTQDAVLFFHAGMIEQALGSRESARKYLKQALKINPYFHPTFPAVAREVLKSR